MRYIANLGSKKNWEIQDGDFTNEIWGIFDFQIVGFECKNIGSWAMNKTP